MNFLPQTTIQPVSGSQAAKAAAELITRPDLVGLTQSSDDVSDSQGKNEGSYLKQKTKNKTTGVGHACGAVAAVHPDATGVTQTFNAAQLHGGRLDSQAPACSPRSSFKPHRFVHGTC